MKLLINHRRCSNYIFILDITPGFNRLRKDNCKTRRKHSSFVIWCCLYCRFNGRYTSIAIMIILCLDIVTQFHYNPIFVKTRHRDVFRGCQLLRWELWEIFHDKNHPTKRSSLHSIMTIFLIFLVRNVIVHITLAFLKTFIFVCVTLCLLIQVPRFG